MSDPVPGQLSPDLSGRVAIITGAGSRGPGIGNGRAISLVLARAGVSVAMVDENPEWLAETERMVAAEGGTGTTLVADVSDPSSCAEVVDEVTRRWQRLDILVNNVGIAGIPGTAVEVDPEQWSRGLAVNATSMMLMAKHVVPVMAAAGGGAIVNVASVAGLLGGYPHLLYPTSKGAVIAMTRAMAVHHGPQGIRVNAVAPGSVVTPMVESRGMTEKELEARRRRTPLGTEGTAWDVAAAVRYLVSDEARWVTGAVLPVDAGLTATFAHPPS